MKCFLGATFNVSTSVKSIESPLSDVIQNDLQSRKEDRRSPSLSNFSSDKDKLSSGKFCIIVVSFEIIERIDWAMFYFVICIW